jgi:hypothetical protein
MSDYLETILYFDKNIAILRLLLYDGLNIQDRGES